MRALFAIVCFASGNLPRLLVRRHRSGADVGDLFVELRFLLVETAGGRWRDVRNRRPVAKLGVDDLQVEADLAVGDVARARFIELRSRDIEVMSPYKR